MTNRVPTRVEVAIIGCGLVGEALIAQLAEFDNSDLVVNLIANSKKFLSTEDHESLDLTQWKADLQSKGKKYKSFDQIHQYIRRGTAAVILVDCTASDEIPNHYPSLLDGNVCIATPNKKGVSGSKKLYDDIRAAEDNTGARLFHEATVGAGLPIISTLVDLVSTGDKVTKIEGIFSGTLSYIFNVWGSGDAKFSDVVKEAKEKGYTEPDPRDDLNGMDVARKLTILARLVGLDIEGPPSSSIFPIDSLIPQALESAKSGDEFVNGLPAHDGEFDEKRTAAKKEGKVVRYVGSIDVATKTIKVGLQAYPTTHPFAGLQGSDNIIAFHTKRYGDRPLIVQGAGAGAEVTAMGVFSDILKFCEQA